MLLSGTQCPSVPYGSIPGTSAPWALAETMARRHVADRHRLTNGQIERSRALGVCLTWRFAPPTRASRRELYDLKHGIEPGDVVIGGQERPHVVIVGSGYMLGPGRSEPARDFPVMGLAAGLQRDCITGA
jgi:hypothetical protein